MTFSRLILHQDYAFDCLVELGYIGKAQFVHIDGADHVPNNKFVNEIQRCEEVERIIKHLQEEINKNGMQTVFYEDADEQKPKASDLIAIERVLQRLDKELIDVLSHCNSLQMRRFELYEHKEVLESIDKLLSDGSDDKTWMIGPPSYVINLLKDSSSLEMGHYKNEASDSRLYILTGSIPMERFAAFEKMIWRVSHGNVYVNFKEFELPDDLIARFNQQRFKYAFVVAVIGEKLRGKIVKVCEGFQTKTYTCPDTSSERWKEIREISIELQNLKEIFQKSCEHSKRVLSVACGDLFLWRAMNRKMLQVYHLMNRFGIVHESSRQYSKYLKAYCWIPHSDLAVVRRALQRGTSAAAGDMRILTFPAILTQRQGHPIDLKPPTYFRTNKFTNGFQHLINAYGIASYRELNPTPYTIVTFPFLFAVMFGDFGHGIIMTVFAAAFVCCEKKIERNQKNSLQSSEIFDMLFAGRYIILLMGIFSMYTGLIYNDTLSKPLTIMDSSWRVNLTNKEWRHIKRLTMDPSNPSHYTGTPYPFGLDPVWGDLAENSITVNNSLKMKVAIIMGVLQMIFGLTLSAGNALFFRSKVDVYLVFVPQLIFMTCLFFYLAILIFHKWAFYGGHGVGEYSTGCAPSILITFINMVLMKSAEEPIKGCSAVMFTGQFEIQRALLIIALLAVPVLLCGKPLHFMYQHRRIKNISDPEHQENMRRSTMKSLHKSLIYNVQFTDSDPHMISHEPEEKLSEIWIHQGIHTIECVLGSVSHTASYLRLWALSLAHCQLSAVLWDMVLATALKLKYGYFNSIIIFFTFAAFALLTLAILILMEGLSAFLHTLRLHWVEFQSKFYGGLGEAFVPFRFQESRRRDSYT